MMYLVFIAMLTLNISKEVLATLGLLNDDIESSIAASLRVKNYMKILKLKRAILVMSFQLNGQK